MGFSRICFSEEFFGIFETPESDIEKSLIEDPEMVEELEFKNNDTDKEKAFISDWMEEEKI